MSQHLFQFKQFSIIQNKSAMKVGTDGVLLGAWLALENCPDKILDIGAGTGLLALIMAQRSTAQQIDAVEIDANAYEECVSNFENSPWNDRLFCYHASLEEFAEEIDDHYDVIVCNPPFYNTNSKTQDHSRNLARFQNAMPFALLLNAVSKLLSKTGTFYVIIPYLEEQNFIQLAASHNLFPNRILHLKGTPNTAIIRSLIGISYHKVNPEIHTLVIEKERHNYTPAYRSLTKDLYLNF